MEKKIAIVGDSEIGLRIAQEVARLKAEGHEVAIVDGSYLKESFPIYNRPLPDLTQLQLEPTKKIDCRKGHTYVEGKCRCGKELVKSNQQK
jgi:hypothetical protein